MSEQSNELTLNLILNFTFQRLDRLESLSILRTQKPPINLLPDLLITSIFRIPNDHITHLQHIRERHRASQTSRRRLVVDS